MDADGNLRSFVFGVAATTGAPAGQWFNPHTTAWVARAREALAMHGGDATAAAGALERRFRDGYLRALRDSHMADGAIPGLCDAHGGFDEGAFDAQLAGVWHHFLEGTFGLCVARPLDEAHIADKEAVQARLTQLTGNGARRDLSPDEKATARALIARYESLAMPFSPAEYPRSSRKRLVEDMLPHVAP